MEKGKTPNILSQDELARQLELMDLMAAENAKLESPPLALVDTYGCQQNEADSETLRGMLSRMGYGFTQDDRMADLVIINTCAVREHAEQRALGNVGALVHGKRDKPDQVIAVCGCMAQEEGAAERIKKSFRHVDMVFGTHALWQFPELLLDQLKNRRRVFHVPPSDGLIAEGLPALRRDKHKAWLSIMYGCNNFCSYCIVPYVRGRERSRGYSHVLDDAGRLISDGVGEITLLGQNVNSYGRDLGGEHDFSDLLEAICAMDGDFWVRFMTSHPKDAGKKLFDTMAANPKCARHIHLPFQAGSDRVLRAMNRGYTAQDYLKLLEYARSVMPDLSVTSDVIVGFPGETEEDFEDTMALLRAADFDALFTFIYSKRPGTPAAKMPDPATREQKQARFDRLIELQNQISSRRHAALVGKTLRVFIDGPGRDARNNLAARTSGNRLVHLNGDSGRIGSFAEVKITAASGFALFAEL